MVSDAGKFVIPLYQYVFWGINSGYNWYNYYFPDCCFLWAENLEKLGEMTPEDMSLTELQYKKNKLLIKGIATTYRGQKDFEQVERFIHVLKSNDDFSNHFTRLRLMHHSLINVRPIKLSSSE